MARSLKKGPFADASLLKKVDALNASGQKQDELVELYDNECELMMALYAMEQC